MDDFKGLDLSQLRLNINPMEGLQRQIQNQQAEMDRTMSAIAEHNSRKDAALFETAEASVAQKELLAEQLDTVKEQNKLLQENYATLKELYELTQKEAESSSKEAKNNKIFGWVSFGVGTLIGIVGVVLGIIFWVVKK